jgi:hypothetical protein
VPSITLLLDDRERELCVVPDRRPFSASEVLAAATCPVCSGPLHSREIPSRCRGVLRQASCYLCGSTGYAELTNAR